MTVRAVHPRAALCSWTLAQVCRTQEQILALEQRPLDALGQRRLQFLRQFQSVLHRQLQLA